MTLHRNGRAKAIRGAAGVGVLALSATLLSGMAPASAQQYPPNPGGNGQAPGQGGNNPGQGGNNPGQGGNNPGQGGNNPGQSGNNPGQSDAEKERKREKEKQDADREADEARRSLGGPGQPGHPKAITGNGERGEKKDLQVRTGPNAGGNRSSRANSAGTWITVASTIVGPDGRYSFSLVPTANMLYRITTTNGDVVTEGPDIAVNVVAKVQQAITRAKAKGRTYTFSGYVEPSVAGITVTFFRNGANGGSVVVGRAVTDATGGYKFNRTFIGSGGTFLFFARTSGGAALAGTSSPKAISIPRK